ncbi:MAG: ParA family protein [Myxococcota bacterium]
MKTQTRPGSRKSNDKPAINETHIHAVLLQKGGACKSTTAANAAAALARMGYRVLIIDLDQQADVSAWFGVQEEEAGRALLDVFTGEKALQEIIRPTETPNLYLIPSSSWLMAANKVLAGEVGSETILRRKLTTLKGKDWDYIFLDCPPNLSVLTINALAAADKVLVPVATQYLALRGLADLMKTLRFVQERLNSDLKIGGILPCRVDRRNRHTQDVLDQLTKTFKDKVFKCHIRENIRLAEAPSFGKTIFQYDPNSKGAHDYAELAKEIVRMDKKQKIRRKKQP